MLGRSRDSCGAEADWLQRALTLPVRTLPALPRHWRGSCERSPAHRAPRSELPPDSALLKWSASVCCTFGDDALTCGHGVCSVGRCSLSTSRLAASLTPRFRATGKSFAGHPDRSPDHQSCGHRARGVQASCLRAIRRLVPMRGRARRGQEAANSWGLGRRWSALSESFRFEVVRRAHYLRPCGSATQAKAASAQQRSIQEVP